MCQGGARLVLTRDQEVDPIRPVGVTHAEHRCDSDSVSEANRASPVVDDDAFRTDTAYESPAALSQLFGAGDVTAVPANEPLAVFDGSSWVWLSPACTTNQPAPADDERDHHRDDHRRRF